MKTIKRFANISKLRAITTFLLFVFASVTLLAQDRAYGADAYVVNYNAKAIGRMTTSGINALGFGVDKTSIRFNQHLDLEGNDMFVFSSTPQNNEITAYLSTEYTGMTLLSKGNMYFCLTDQKKPFVTISSNNYFGINTTEPSEVFQMNKGNARFEDSKVYMGYTYGESINVSTTNRNKYALFVQKGILSEDYAIGPKSSWADFVFDKDYKLRSLDEVEEFIDTNNHLPELPSTKEIQDEGYSLHDMNVKLLQKVEELTLYVIRLNKEIEGLKKEK